MRAPCTIPGPAACRFNYLGHHRYSLTICAKRPAAPFLDEQLVSVVLRQLRQLLAEEGFALLAYCFMPDHVHMVIEGLAETSDLQRLVARWKQTTGYCYKQQTGRSLWLSGFYDRILRDGERTLDAVHYVLMNPVRAGLVQRSGEYRFSGSDVFSEAELSELLSLSAEEQA